MSGVVQATGAGRVRLAVAVALLAAGLALPVSAAAAEPGKRPGDLALCGVGYQPVTPLTPAALAASEPNIEGASPAPDAAASALINPLLPPVVAAQALAAAWPRIQASLAASPDVRQQAAALRLAGIEALETGSDAQAVRTRADTQRRLAALALATSDATAMQWAVRSCDGATAPGGCLGLSARHWVCVEPGNLAAWLYLLAQEPLARDEALHGMALSRRADFADRRLAAVVDAGLPADIPPYLRVVLAVLLTGIDAAQSMPSLQALQRACDAPALKDSNRRQQCAALAGVMLGNGSSLTTLALGTRLGQHAGWPAERVQALRAELAVLPALHWQAMVTDQPYGCSAVAGMRRWLAGTEQMGELGWLRQQRLATGR